jgi:hypothetical protein
LPEFSFISEEMTKVMIILSIERLFTWKMENGFKNQNTEGENITFSQVDLDFSIK